MRTTIIVTGDLLRGHDFIGPFDDREKAEQFAQSFVPGPRMVTTISPIGEEIDPASEGQFVLLEYPAEDPFGGAEILGPVGNIDDIDPDLRRGAWVAFRLLRPAEYLKAWAELVGSEIDAWEDRGSP